MEDKILSIREAAKRLSISASLLYNHITTGKIKTYRLGHKRFVKSSDLQKLNLDNNSGNIQV